MEVVKEYREVKSTLVVKGVKKRCRKVGTHRIKLRLDHPDKVNKERLKELSLKGIDKFMRKVESAYISLQPQDVTVYDNGVASSSYMMMTDEKIPLEL